LPTIQFNFVYSFASLDEFPLRDTRQARAGLLPYQDPNEATSRLINLKSTAPDLAGMRHVLLGHNALRQGRHTDAFVNI